MRDSHWIDNKRIVRFLKNLWNWRDEKKAHKHSLPRVPTRNSTHFRLIFSNKNITHYCSTVFLSLSRTRCITSCSTSTLGVRYILRAFYFRPLEFRSNEQDTRHERKTDINFALKRLTELDKRSARDIACTHTLKRWKREYIHIHIYNKRRRRIGAGTRTPMKG